MKKREIWLTGVKNVVLRDLKITSTSGPAIDMSDADHCLIQGNIVVGAPIQIGSGVRVDGRAT